MNRFPGSDTASRVLEHAVSRGAGLAELFLESTTRRSVLCEEGHIEKVSGGIDHGFGLRLIFEDRTVYGYSSVVTGDEMMRLAGELAAELDGGGGRFTPPGDIEVGSMNDVEVPAGSIGLEDKAALVLAADRAAREAGGAVTQVSVSYGESSRRIRVYASDGTAAGDDGDQILLGVRAVASSGPELQTAWRSAGGRRGYELLGEDRVRELAFAAGESAAKIAAAPRAPGGTMTVVLAGRAGGTMVHEAIGHGLEGDAVMKDLSVYSGRVGEKVASELVTIVDDGSIRGCRGSYSCDDEGTPSGRTVLVDRGVLRGWLLDRRSAARMGLPLTGNGRREDFRHRPIVRMSNTMIMPGGHDPEEIVSGVARGLYVVRMGGGQVDPTSGDFVFRVSEAYLIEDGKVAEPVRGATLIGNGPEVLGRIDRVGSDQGFDIGTCGKDGQHVPVSDGQPTLRIPSITVGGEV